MAQLNLSAWFAGKNEVVPPDVKRGPGRPKRLPEATEATDAVLQAIEAQPAHHEMLSEVRGSDMKRYEKGRDGGFGVRMYELARLRGVEVADMRLPGGKVRRTGEGPQLKLKLCEWMDRIARDCGGTDEVWQAVLGAAAEEWCKGKSVVRAIYKNKSKWQRQCEVRGGYLCRFVEV